MIMEVLAEIGQEMQISPQEPQGLRESHEEACMGQGMVQREIDGDWDNICADCEKGLAESR